MIQSYAAHTRVGLGVNWACWPKNVGNREGNCVGNDGKAVGKSDGVRDGKDVGNKVGVLCST